MATEQSMERATIIDVAHASGVSRQTVSNVLNRPEKVAPETLQRVRREIERLGFTPNVTAQQLRRQRAAAYGFEVNPSGHRRMGHVLDEFLVELTVSAPRHKTHLVTFAPDPRDVIAGYRQTLRSGLVDGFVLADTRHDDPRPQWLLDHEVPFVCFGRVWDMPELRQWVDVDGAAGIRAAVGHLVDRGYDQVGFLGWPAGSPVGDDRRRGWREALAAAGLDGSDLAEESVQDLDEATAAASRLLDRVSGSAALVCASDLLALGALRAARDHGLQPGRDLGIVGFDDTDVAEALQLTSIRQPLAEAARTAWDLLLSGEPALRDEPVLLVPDLTIRASTDHTSTPTTPTSTPTSTPASRAHVGSGDPTQPFMEEQQ